MLFFAHPLLAFPSLDRGLVEAQSSGYSTITMHRVQGATWVNNLLNADTADASGLSYFLDKFDPEARYTDPVVATYSVDVAELDNRTGNNGTGYAAACCATCPWTDRSPPSCERAPSSCAS